ncbi:hypothetical protein Tco_1436101 [Tanacetum coccineum]
MKNQSLLFEPIPNVPDEVVYEEWDDRVGRATTAAASLDAVQASGNITKTQLTAIPNVPISQEIGTGGSPRCQEAMGGSINQTKSKKVPTQSYDLPLPRVNTLGSDEGKIQGRHGQEIEFETKVYTVEDVSIADAVVTTAGASISTASPLRISTAKNISTTETLVYIRRSATKDKVVRLQEQLNKEARKRIARVHEEASSFNIKEWEDIQATTEANEELAQRIQVEEREKYSKVKK